MRRNNVRCRACKKHLSFVDNYTASFLLTTNAAGAKFATCHSHATVFHPAPYSLTLFSSLTSGMTCRMPHTCLQLA